MSIKVASRSLGEKIGVVAHDAGAANHIIAWLKTGYLNDENVKVCLSGPAKIAYSAFNSGFVNCSIDDLLACSDWLLSGTSWPASFEYDARKIAIEKEIKTIAVVDHWTNYEKRFCFYNKIILPDLIWVTDSYAELLASHIFESTPVELKPNHFIDLQKEAISFFERKSESKKNQDARKKILFVMEPVPSKWGGKSIPGEIQALEYFLERQSTLQPYFLSPEGMELVIKPHPSDHPGKYTAWLNSYPFDNIVIDESTGLAELIAWSDIVVGCQTYAMVVALAAGKKVISAIPDYAPPCILPHKEIIHLRT